MRGRLQGVSERVIAEAVTREWGLDLAGLRYLPVGAGAYHWTTEGTDGRRWFVTCDDLDTKPWLGHERDDVFDNLLLAYGAAADLRRSGLDFVAAPTPSRCGPPAVRVDDRHCVAVLELVDGDAGSWGRRVRPGARDELVATLARLHGCTPPAEGLPHHDIDAPGRARLEGALDDLDVLDDTDGAREERPLAEAAQRLLRIHGGEIVDELDDLDRLIGEVDAVGATLVVTHGEPHPGNLIRHRDGPVLIDWDTVALAPPERDLWMMWAADEGTIEAYRRCTGIELDRDLLEAYRLRWKLADIAAYSAQLRGHHRADADAHGALASLRSLLEGDEPAPYGRMHLATT